MNFAGDVWAMPKNDPLLTTLLDLDAALNGSIKLIVGGGYGLYLKQLHLKKNGSIQTLFPIAQLPVARTTEDIDLILHAEVVTDPDSMHPIRKAIDDLSFEVVPGAEFMQFVRPMGPGVVKIDLLSAPLGNFASRVPKDKRRVRPQPSVKLHAHKMDEAITVEEHPFPVEISGVLSSGKQRSTTVFIPQAFAYLMMKLTAFHDRLHDEDKDLGRHHAIDVYRIIGLLTESEYDTVIELSRNNQNQKIVAAARAIAEEHFMSSTGLGQIRIREHQLASDEMNLELFAEELKNILLPQT